MHTFLHICVWTFMYAWGYCLSETKFIMPSKSHARTHVVMHGHMYRLPPGEWPCISMSKHYR